ncbi:MAG: heparinase II/III-family protein [Planctomycetaceae bacterium]|nr:heparinase II/III-family protein [Planctomycetaceae bacterium]
MRNLTIIVLMFTLSMSLSTSLFGQDGGAANVQKQSLESRSKQIAALLQRLPASVGRPIFDRDAWIKLPENNIVKTADKLAKTAIPELPETLYKEYYRNGNRTNYQNMRNQKYKRLQIFTLAECIENKGRFIKPLEETIKSICDDKSWLLPAHDPNGKVYDGEIIRIDLMSSHTSCELALASLWLGDKLSFDVKKLIVDNIERRTFQSYENAVNSGNNGGNWWITGNNNWNAVCHCNMVCTALALIDDVEKRAWYIAAAEKFITYFLNGFTADGYCSEGIGYWNYGFGHFLQLAEIVYQNTGGKVDFFKMPRVRECAMFAFKMEVTPELYAAFADCSVNAKPDKSIAKFASKKFNFGYENYENYQDVLSDLKTTAVFCFPNSASKMPKTAPQPTPLAELRSDFPEGGVVILRPFPNAKNQLAAVIKAGHNAEHHNHNDIGSYTIMYAGKTPLLDPGGEVYTRRTFSAKRYESALLNSFGHPVPVVNGKLQKTGNDAKGKFIAKNFADENDSCTIDFAAAYAQKEIKKLERTYNYARKIDGKPNQFTVTDEIEFESNGTFETALLTYQPYINKTQTKIHNQNENITTENYEIELLIGENDNEKIKVIIAATENEKILPLKINITEINEHPLAKIKPIRIGCKINKKIQKAKIKTIITPAI